MLEYMSSLQMASDLHHLTCWYVSGELRNYSLPVAECLIFEESWRPFFHRSRSALSKTHLAPCTPSMIKLSMPAASELMCYLLVVIDF